MNTKSNFKDKRLLFSFAVLILLTAFIGLIGIQRIQSLSRRIEDLGRRNLKLQKVIWEMKINSTVYAMGIRNYVFWKVSRYLGAVPMAIDPEKIFSAGEGFKEQVKIYEDNIISQEQKDSAKQIAASFAELTVLGRQITGLAEGVMTEETDESVNKLLMTFENRLYKIDKFIDDNVTKQNLKDIERQLEKTDFDKRSAVLFLIFAISGAVIIGVTIALTVYRHRRQERIYRQQLFNQMVHMEESERKNLSAEIHDQMGQDLSGLKIYLGLIEQEIMMPQETIAKGTELKEKIDKCRKIVSSLIEKSHNIAFLLRPPVLDELGIEDSLEALLLDYKHLTNIKYVYRKPEEKLNLPSEYSLLFYRVAQELLTNMAKYSKANNVEIKLNKYKDAVEFFYRDDGIGFDYNAIVRREYRRKEDKFRLGLLGLKERIELLEGKMCVDTAPGKGTRIVVKLNM